MDCTSAGAAKAQLFEFFGTTNPVCARRDGDQAGLPVFPRQLCPGRSGCQ